ncbi:hypothetical protein STAHO0001_0029 [Staphylococcus hominis SK119]|nr:hypothetical protein STAHO0001_0029 [Staphylococcus hominis SK119]EHR90533.1 hypothetical protein SEVCU122_1636 [Staphylococcus hominis VCU122]
MLFLSIYTIKNQSQGVSLIFISLKFPSYFKEDREELFKFG